jgi:hypothetical protein
MLAKYQRPRMLATLTVPVLGTREQRIRQAQSTETITLTVRPRHARLERTDHNTSDELSLTLDWSEAGIDARLMDDAVVTFYLGQADEFGHWQPSREDIRFIGLCKHDKTSRETDEPGTVELDAVDYTTLFLSVKEFGSSGVPLYSDTLRDAWRRLCSQTPGTEILADRLVAQGGDEEAPDLGRTIGSVVAERFRKAGQVHVKPGMDPWSIWQHVVGMMGLISWIDLDTCVVSTATNLYSERDPPRMVWAKNFYKWEESRGDYVAHKGIALTSYDPLTATVLESFYPPVGDRRTRRKSLRAQSTKKKPTEAAILQNEDREYLSYPGITTQAALDMMAQRVWEERSRQELGGRIETSCMDTETFAGNIFDLLTLRAGDSINVTIEQRDRAFLRITSTEDRVAWLRARGYEDGVARLIAANAEIIAGLPSVFYVKNAGIEMEISKDSPHFGITIDYVNRIDIDGGASP